MEISEAPVEAPAETPTETPAETPAETAAEAAAETSADPDATTEHASEPAQKGIAKVDVGGTRFFTTLDTMRRVKGSVFAAPELVEACRRGKVPFIDRDPQLFPYILNYLRNPDKHSFIGPTADLERRRLLQEAEFYRLPALVELLSNKALAVEQIDPSKVEAPLARFLYMSFERTLMRSDDLITSAVYTVNGHEVSRGGVGWFSKQVSIEELEDAFRLEVSQALEKYNKVGYDVLNMSSCVTTQTVNEVTRGEKLCHDYSQHLVITVILERKRV